MKVGLGLLAVAIAIWMPTSSAIARAETVAFTLATSFADQAPIGFSVTPGAVKRAPSFVLCGKTA